ncbi:hydrolase [Streptomyces sp. H39-S7]|uniref:hydrolase n=1 Tax=Streptomyces sp. H39-S7 TaxID=3004357 RepID=UPI0022AF78BB|nr:hydrolase [Streptomyces sp. H39-S7]MCZ4120308.1 hydrolase [Streptomyces sp. H39-S7]
MSLWTSLDPASTTVDAGSTATVRLRFRNTGDVVDEYRFAPVGEIAPYVTVEPPTLRLYPGTTGTVQLTFAPPRTPDATAGPNPYAVQIIPTEHPEATTVPEGNLTITPFTEIRAELVPHTVKGRFRGRTQLAIDNVGNTTLTASITGNDNGDELSYDIHPANVQIEPGRAAFVNATLRPRRLIWLGHKQERPYRLALRRSGTTPLDIDGTYIQRGFLPRWLATLLTLLIALAVIFLILWFTKAAAVTSQATPQASQPAVTTLPLPPASVPPTPSGTPSPTPSGTPSPAPTETQAKAGGGGGAPAEPKAKPKPDTASVAVTELNAKDPGRHVCYRAYVAGIGWQHSVCDGDIAGTQNEGRSIEAVNIAVSGSRATSGNAFMETVGFAPSWASAAEKKDLTVGTPGKGLQLDQFTMSLSDGVICGNAFIERDQWLGKQCDHPGGPGNWISVGVTDKTLHLEAFQLKMDNMDAVGN